MAETELTDEQARAIGLEQELSDEQARALGLDTRSFRGHGASGTWELPDPGPLRAVATKFNEGLTKRGSDELVGLIATTQLDPTPGRYLRLPDGREVPAQTQAETHRAFREGERLNRIAAEQHWPKLGFVADMAGEVAGDAALAGSKMASMAYQVPMGIARGYFGTDSDDPFDQAVGAGIGGISSYLLTKAVSPEVIGAASQTRLARAIAESRAGQVVGQSVDRALSWPSEALRRVAARRATSAAGFIQKDLNDLPAGSAERIGSELLRRDGVIRFGRTAEELRPGILDAQKTAGREVGEIHKAADELSGGSGAEVRRAVGERRLADKNLQAAQGEAEAMYVDSAQTRAAEDMATRRAFADAERRRLVSDSLVTGQDRQALAGDIADTEAVRLFGERGTSEAFQGAGRLPSDLVRERIMPADPRVLTEGLGFDAHGFADTVERRLIPELDDPILKPLKGQIQSLLEAYRVKAARGLSHAEANAWKTTIQKTIRKFQDAPISQEAKIKLQGILDDEIEQSIGAKLGQDVIPKYRDAKAAYGALKEAGKANRSAVARDAGNNKVGWTELMAMGLGGSAGAHGGSASTLMGGASMALGAHLLKHRGASAAAVSANWLGGGLAAIIENSPQVLGEFGAVIAGQKTPEARAAMAEELALRYPAFAQMLEELSQPGDAQASPAPAPTPRPGDPLRATRTGR